MLGDSVDWVDVFALLENGLNQREIAQRLRTSRKTVWRVIQETRAFYEAMWSKYESRGQIKPKHNGARKMGGDGAYYQANRFLTGKEAHRVLNRTVEAVSLASGEIEYFLMSNGQRIGKLDHKRLWAKRLIQAQESASGGWIDAAHQLSQDDDGFGTAGEPG